MKNKKQKPERRPAAAAEPKRARWGALRWAVLAAAACAAAFIAYRPALHGEFVFDDWALPFTAVEFENAPLSQWMAGTRPFLMLSFWANYVWSGLDPFSFHVTNVILHLIAAAFVAASVRRILEAAGETGSRRDWLALFAGAVFLLHPLQTESVAYVASRSEVLSVSIFYGAFAIFLYAGRKGIGWAATIAVVVLFAAAVRTKEHTAVLPVLMLLTDWYWNPPFSFAGIKRNWKVYGLMLAGGISASLWVVNVIRQSDTAGMSLREATWYEYFLTQCRVIWLYVRLFFFPVGLNVDHDVRFSRGLMDGGALFGLIALAGLAAAAVIYRRRYPLFSYGTMIFLLLLAPTSSFVPILDPVAEHRMYLAMPGLILAVLELVRRISQRRAAWVCGAACAVLFAATAVRSEAWAGPLPLWRDAVSKSPNKYRPRFQLGWTYYKQGRCADALKQFEVAGKVAEQPQYTLYLNWALVYDCAGQPERALERIRQAIALSPSAHTYSILGMLYGKRGNTKEALAALDTAVKLDPNFQPAWVFLGATYGSAGELAKSVEAYRRAIALKPDDDDTRRKLALVEAQLGRR